MNFIQDGGSKQKTLVRFFFSSIFHVWCCVFLHVFVDVEAQGPRWEPSSIALPIVAEAGALNQTHLTDMASLACQLALGSLCFCLLRLELQVGCHTRDNGFW